MDGKSWNQKTWQQWQAAAPQAAADGNRKSSKAAVADVPQAAADGNRDSSKAAAADDPQAAAAGSGASSSAAGSGAPVAAAGSSAPVAAAGSGAPEALFESQQTVMLSDWHPESAQRIPEHPALESLVRIVGVRPADNGRYQLVLSAYDVDREGTPIRELVWYVETVQPTTVFVFPPPP